MRLNFIEKLLKIQKKQIIYSMLLVNLFSLGSQAHVTFGAYLCEVLFLNEMQSSAEDFPILKNQERPLLTAEDYPVLTDQQVPLLDQQIPLLTNEVRNSEKPSQSLAKSKEHSKSFLTDLVRSSEIPTSLKRHIYLTHRGDNGTWRALLTDEFKSAQREIDLDPFDNEYPDVPTLENYDTDQRKSSGHFHPVGQSKIHNGSIIGTYPRFNEKLLQSNEYNELHKVLLSIFLDHKVPSNMQLDMPQLAHEFGKLDQRLYLPLIQKILVSHHYDNQRDIFYTRLRNRETQFKETIAYLIQKKVSDEKVENLFIVVLVIEQRSKLPKVKVVFKNNSIL